MTDAWIKIICVLLVSGFLSCSNSLTVHMPDALPGEENAVLQKKTRAAQALDLFRDDKIITGLLNEFIPAEISAGIYRYRGMTVYLGIGMFNNADDAYGVYTGLSAYPRKRWNSNDGELSFKSPYFTGIKGRYAFWFYSSPNPGNYFKFYEDYGEKFMRELSVSLADKINNLSYFIKLLPVQNRYMDSTVFIRSRKTGSLELTGAYGASYQAGNNIAHIFIEGFNTEDYARTKYQEYQVTRVANDIKVRTFPPVIIGNPSRAFSYKSDSGFCVIYNYRRLIFIISEIPDLKYANQFIRNIYANMQNLKDGEKKP